MNTQILDNNDKIKKDTEVLIINSYGQTKSYYSVCKNIFLGGSLIDHGGQNPLEATRFGCKVMYGPSIYNFKEIYQLLSKKKMATQIRNEKNIIKSLDNSLSKSSNFKKKQKELNRIGKKILKNYYKEISLLKKNEY